MSRSDYIIWMFVGAVAASVIVGGIQSWQAFVR